MANNRIKTGTPAIKTNTEEAQRQQILRAIAIKRESLFQLILGNLLSNPSAVTFTKVEVSGDGMKEKRHTNVEDLVDEALRGADHAIELLFPIKNDE